VSLESRQVLGINVPENCAKVLRNFLMCPARHVSNHQAMAVGVVLWKQTQISEGGREESGGDSRHETRLPRHSLRYQARIYSAHLRIWPVRLP
jgi:hypothetical protein